MSVTDEFRALAETIVDDLLAADPVGATWLGDHRFDALLPDLSAAGVSARLGRIDGHLTALDAVDDVELDTGDAVDLEILRSSLLHQRFDLEEVQRLRWDPMSWNPGTALHLLMIRDFAPAQDRAASARSRLAAFGDHFAAARDQLGDMSAIHLDTAVAQLAGTRHLVDGQVRAFVDDDVAADRAVRDVDDFVRWLEERRGDAHRDPRLGERLYAGALWHAMDDDVTATALLADAEAHLDLLAEQLATTARAYLGGESGSSDDEVVRRALAAVAQDAPVTDDTVLPLMREAMDRATAFVRSCDLVTVPDVETRVVDMPEIHRGIAVAYCDAPGPLEGAAVPTYVAVAPTPAQWDAERVQSFYREYNAVQLHDLAIHEAMPGHVLQLAHAQQLVSPTRVRRFGRSGVFVEGWAVYAEQAMLDRGYAPADDDRSALALRLQQLKMQARSAINTILDIGVHAGGMTEAEGLALMRDRGFQEEGEAVGKWRRALLTAGQLPTYFTGYLAVRRIVDDLRVLHPDWPDRAIHDLVLSQGSPAPRHLRTLLGI